MFYLDLMLSTNTVHNSEVRGNQYSIINVLKPCHHLCVPFSLLPVSVGVPASWSSILPVSCSLSPQLSSSFPDYLMCIQVPAPLLWSLLWSSDAEKYASNVNRVVADSA